MKKSERKERLRSAIQSEVILLRKNLPRSIRSRSGKGLAWLVDMRQIFMRAELLEDVATLFWDAFAEDLPVQVGGLATGAIPFVTAIVLKGHQLGYEVNGFIVRKERKNSGMCKQIEGDLSDRPVVIFDDLLNSGSSLERVRLALEQEGHTVSKAFFLMDFGLESTQDYLQTYGIEAQSVFSADEFDLPIRRDQETWEEPTLEFEWMFEPENPNYTFSIPNSNPVCDDRCVYFGGSDNFFYALNQKTGDMEWRFRVGKTPKSIFSSPILHEGILYFGAYDGNVYALDAETGYPKWCFQESDFIGSSPAIAPDLGLLFIGAEFAMPGNHGALLALSLETGEGIWWAPVQEFMHASPYYLADRQSVAVGSNDGFVLLLDARTGELIWSFETGGEVKHGLAYDAQRSLLCFGSFDGHIYGVDVETGRERFRIQTENKVYATPLIVDRYVFCPSTDRCLYIIDLDTGEIARKVYSFGKIYSSPALLNGLVFWGGNDGLFRGIDPQTFEQREWIRVPERLLSQTTYADGLYFINGAGSTLMAFKKKSAHS